MSLGPIEVVVLAFPGNEFNGSILPELQRLVDDNTVSIVDALLLTKDADGDVIFIEVGQDGMSDEVAALAALVDQLDDLISDDDVMELAAGLEPNSSGAILVFEHTWIKPLRDAIVSSGGVLAANFRVPGAVVDEVLAELANAE